ncbi:hypothetical protein MSG28_001121 [Choristoneura fumiferana]|uniref:Uncharacterized protein n=1 Tax=Choristoneura fumiferana TaxID=7141 RepID=A0ACC0K3Q2_CHOFU|nr:hypothetical protein MSG28_001121 [Choristoneura fumiferana]
MLRPMGRATEVVAMSDMMPPEGLTRPLQPVWATLPSRRGAPTQVLQDHAECGKHGDGQSSLQPPGTRPAAPCLERLVFVTWICIGCAHEIHQLRRSVTESPHLQGSNARTVSGPLGDSPLLAAIVTILGNSWTMRGPLVVNAASTRHVLGLELISPAKANRLRCSVAVFVCWAFLVAFGLGFYLFQIVIQPSLEDIGLNETWYFHRDDWQAMPMYGQDFLKLPLKYVVIGHTGWQACEEKYSCIDKMMETQRDNLGRGFKDIVPNFLVGGDGLLFEGRGANVQAAMVRSWNVKSITIMFIGDFRTDEPNTLQFEHVNILLEQLVKKGVLEPDFVLYGQCQLAHNTIPPGPKIMDRLNELLHWDPKDKNKCLH